MAWRGVAWRLGQREVDDEASQFGAVLIRQLGGADVIARRRENRNGGRRDRDGRRRVERSRCTRAVFVDVAQRVVTRVNGNATKRDLHIENATGDRFVAARRQRYDVVGVAHRRVGIQHDVRHRQVWVRTRAGAPGGGRRNSDERKEHTNGLHLRRERQHTCARKLELWDRELSEKENFRIQLR